MTVTPEEKLAAVRAKLDQPRAETYKFAHEGDEIAGTVARLDTADTAYGPAKIIVIDPGDGALRSVWLIHDALLSQMRKLKPRPGDMIAIRYNGRQVSGNQRSYHSYTVSTDREQPGFDWDDAPAARAPLAGPDGDPWASDAPSEPNPFHDDDEPEFSQPNPAPGDAGAGLIAQGIQMPDYAVSVFPQHQRLLQASAIDPEVARERGYVSVDTKTRLAPCGFTKGQQTVPGLLIPIHGTDGELRLHQYRPDEPRIDAKGRSRKYETPWRHQLCIDVPPRIRDQLAAPDVALWVTEGARKADAAVTAGLCCISLLGVEGWQSKGVALPDWKDIRLKDRDVLIAFDSDVMTKPEVRGALNRLTAWLAYRGASVRHVTLDSTGDGKAGLDDYLAAGGTVADLITGSVHQNSATPTAAKEPATSATTATAELLPDWDGNLAGLLDDIHAFLGRFIAHPSGHAHIAHTLWCAHAHQMDAWESTPRIAFLSPEPGSGKTRALEVSELLVPRPVEAVNTTPAYLFRKVSDPVGLPTILYDEIDTLFGPKAKDNEEIRGMLNAGHRRGAVAGRCVTRGDIIVTEELPAYCALALAGLGGLPDTLLSRSVVVRMKRRGPAEKVEAFRHRVHKDAGHALRGRLASWAAASPLDGLWPDMPAGIEDRDADVWEALLMVADAAGGDWPKLAREAAVALVADAKAATPSLGIRLLSDLRDVWDDTDGMHTATILGKLNGLDEAPWGDLKGKPLDPRKLSRFLRDYDVRPCDVRADVDGIETVRKGYKREDLHDAWQRYLPADDRPRCITCGEALDQSFIDAGFTDHGYHGETAP